MKKSLLLAIVVVVSAALFGISLHVGVGVNLDMSSGDVITPFFAQISVGTPVVRAIVHSYIFSMNWSNFVVKGYSIPGHSYAGIVLTPVVFNSLYVKGQFFWSLKHLADIAGGKRTPAGTPLYSRIGFGSYLGNNFMLDGGFDGYWQLNPRSLVPFARPYLALDYIFTFGNPGGPVPY